MYQRFLHSYMYFLKLVCDNESYNHIIYWCHNTSYYMYDKRKRKRSDSALWQKPLHRHKNPKSNVSTQRTPPKTSITQRLQTDLGRSAGVTIAIQLVAIVTHILKGKRNAYIEFLDVGFIFRTLFFIISAMYTN